MASRGAYGFKVDGQYKITYCHTDAYPDALGREIVHFCRNVEDWGLLKQRVREVVMVDEEKKANVEWQIMYRVYSDSNVATGDPEKWYNLLRKLQNGGYLDAIYNGEVVHMTDAYDFLLDSLFCTYAYIIDIDSMELKIYRGYQEQPNPDNEFGQEPYKGNEDFDYYPVDMIGSYSVYDIPKRWDELL